MANPLRRSSPVVTGTVVLGNRLQQNLVISRVLAPSSSHKGRGAVGAEVVGCTGKGSVEGSVSTPQKIFIIFG